MTAPDIRSGETSAEVLAAYVAELRFDALSETTVSAAKRVLIDYFACAISGAEMPTPRIVRTYLAERGEKARASVFGTPMRMSACSAAMANGAAAHSLDFDDGHTRASAHPAGAIVSAALAQAESVGATPRDLVTAIVAGYEVMLRVASAMHPVSASVGWHNTAVGGVIGSAAAAASLLKLDAVATRDAIGLATSFAGGIREYLDDGAEVKRLHPGKAARDGILCADLARRGITGTVDAFEGRHGLFSAMLHGKAQPAELTDGLGGEPAIENVYFKPYPCCRHFHSAIEAVLGLRAEHGLTPDQIDTVSIGLYAVGAKGHDAQEVSNFLEAQMSAPYATAVALWFGDVAPEHFAETARTDPQIAAFVRQVDVFVDPECEELYPKRRSGSVVIRLKGGRSLSRRILDPKGEGDNPMTDEDLRRKLESCLSGTDFAGNAPGIVEAIDRLETLGGLDAVVQLVGKEPSQ